MSSVRSAAALLTAVLALSAAAPAPAQEKPNPLAAQVKAAVKDPTKPFTMLFDFKIKEDAGKKFEATFAKAVKLTRKEKGCLAYDLNRDPKTPTRYLLYERWENLASMEAHLKSAHITALLKELGDLLEGPPELRVLIPAAD
jgi:quinol monooxygenase YgiN